MSHLELRHSTIVRNNSGHSPNACDDPGHSHDASDDPGNSHNARDDPEHSPDASDNPGHSSNVSDELDSIITDKSDVSLESDDVVELNADLLIETPSTDGYGDLQLSLPGPSCETSHYDICSGNFGKVVKLKAECNLTDIEKYKLLKNHFIPASNFKL